MSELYRGAGTGANPEDSVLVPYSVSESNKDARIQELEKALAAAVEALRSNGHPLTCASRQVTTKKQIYDYPDGTIGLIDVDIRHGDCNCGIAALANLSQAAEAYEQRVRQEERERIAGFARSVLAYLDPDIPSRHQPTSDDLREVASKFLEQEGGAE